MKKRIIQLLFLVAFLPHIALASSLSIYNLSTHHLQHYGTSDTFQFGSISKLFVAVKLTQKNLPLDSTLSYYKPLLNEQILKRWGHVTLRQLLNMTSGIPTFAVNPSRHSGLSINEKLNIALSQPDQFQPGQGWRYSETNYLLLGLILDSFNVQHDKSNLDNATHDLIATSDQLSRWMGRLFDPTDPLHLPKWYFTETVDKSTGQPSSKRSQPLYAFALDRLYLKDIGIIWYYPGNTVNGTALVAYIPKYQLSVAAAIDQNVDFDEFFNKTLSFIIKEQIEKTS